MRTVVIVVLLLILAGGGFYYYQSQQKATPATQTTVNTPANNGAMKAEPSTSSNGAMMKEDSASSVKEFTVEGKDFSFSPSTLSVNKGDKVKITFKNSGGMHDFVLPDFNAKTDVIQSGAQATVEFTADKAGSFQYFCSVGNHKAMGMVGTLTVK